MRVASWSWRMLCRRAGPLCALLLLALYTLRVLLLPDQPQDRPAVSDVISAVRLANIRRRILVERVVNNFSYETLLSPSGGLCTSDVTLLALVTSAVNNWEQRQAIRDTWGSRSEVALLFLLGSSDPEAQEQLKNEADEHNDVLQHNFHDSYRNLTLKTVLGLKWTEKNCANVRYVVKTDDDIYWNVPLLMSHLNTTSGQRYITGCIKQYAVPEPIPVPAGGAGGAISGPPGYPLFAAGAGYLLTRDLLPDLLLAAERLRLLPVEDVFVTGYCAQLAQSWPPRHHPGFSCGEMLPDDCQLVHLFNAHKITPARQYRIWDTFNSQPNPCMDF